MEELLKKLSKNLFDLKTENRLKNLAWKWEKEHLGERACFCICTNKETGKKRVEFRDRTNGVLLAEAVIDKKK